METGESFLLTLIKISSNLCVVLFCVVFIGILGEFLESLGGRFFFFSFGRILGWIKGEVVEIAIVIKCIVVFSVIYYFSLSCVLVLCSFVK